MAGVLFIINVPQKDHEEKLRKNANETAKPRANYELQRNKKLGGSVESYAQDEVDIVISKCKPTDYLNADKNVNLHKSKSEITLNVNDYIDGGKSYVKSSWDEIKQAVKLTNKNKLIITGPVRRVDILEAFHWDTPLEIILADVVARLAVKNATWTGTRNNKFWQVTFSLESSSLCEELLEVLRTFGIGTRHESSVCVVPCALYYNSNNGVHSEEVNSGKYENSKGTAWSRFSSSVRARTNLAQVLHDVRADATLTFDWLFLLVAAAFVAAVGLMENSTVILVASMLISPLMGPITAGTLGTAVRDRSLQYMGVMHELMGLFLCLVIGFLFGLAICTVDGRYGVVDDWPTPEMMSRCELRSLFVGVLIAIPSGACVALAVLSDYTSSLVGVAISASLLPPAVNAGLLWSMSLFRLVVTKIDINWVVVDPVELAVLGTASLCLTLTNIVCIFMSGVVAYKVKAVCPLDRRDITWWRARKNLLQNSKHDCNDDRASWDKYSKWSNETSETKDLKIPVVHSDTVTYRRPGAVQRKRTQSIEECFRKAQIDDSYEALDSSDTTECESQNSEEPNKSHATNLSYYNYRYGFRDLESTKTQSPTIEPSLTLTVDPKMNKNLKT